MPPEIFIFKALCDRINCNCLHASGYSGNYHLLYCYFYCLLQLYIKLPYNIQHMSNNNKWRNFNHGLRFYYSVSYWVAKLTTKRSGLGKVAGTGIYLFGGLKYRIQYVIRKTLYNLPGLRVIGIKRPIKGTFQPMVILLNAQRDLRAHLKTLGLINQEEYRYYKEDIEIFFHVLCVPSFHGYPQKKIWTVYNRVSNNRATLCPYAEDKNHSVDAICCTSIL